MLFTIIAVLASGICVAIQAPLLAMVSRTTGLLAGVLLAVLGSSITLAVACVALRVPLVRVATGRTLLLALIAGALGAGVMVVLTIAVPRLGVLSTLILSIAAQLVAGCLLDRLGVFGLDVRLLEPQRIAGMLILVLGAFLVVR